MKSENHRTLAQVQASGAAGRGTFLFRWRKAILVICIVMWIGAFTATHVPGKDIPGELASLGDAVLHGAGFLGLSSWFILALAAAGVRPARRAAIVLAVMMLYGAVDERTQPYFGRSCELGDWITDTVATGVAVVLWETAFLVARRIARGAEETTEETTEEEASEGKMPSPRAGGTPATHMGKMPMPHMGGTPMPRGKQNG